MSPKSRERETVKEKIDFNCSKKYKEKERENGGGREKGAVKERDRVEGNQRDL